MKEVSWKELVNYIGSTITYQYKDQKKDFVVDNFSNGVLRIKDGRRYLFISENAEYIGDQPKIFVHG